MGAPLLFLFYDRRPEHYTAHNFSELCSFKKNYNSRLYLGYNKVYAKKKKKCLLVAIFLKEYWQMLENMHVDYFDTHELYYSWCFTWGARHTFFFCISYLYLYLKIYLFFIKIDLFFKIYYAFSYFNYFFKQCKKMLVTLLK